MPHLPVTLEGKLMQPKYRNRNQASAYLEEKWCLRRSRNYLAKLAVVGGGPAFSKANRTPLYSEDDLDEYAKNLIGPRVRSTSELPPAKPPVGSQ
jgi:hypothetical protein